MFKSILLLFLAVLSFATMAQTVIEASQTEQRNGLIYLKGETSPFTGTAVAWLATGKKPMKTP